MILIASLSNDLHALSVQQRVRREFGHSCAIIEVDRLAYSQTISFDWTIAGARRLIDRDETEFWIDDVNVIWWRRPRGRQAAAEGKAFGDLINNECFHALSGCLMAHAQADWVSDPGATIAASNKLYQLAVAERQGFRVPGTMVTQTKAHALDFIARHNGNVVTKVIAGAEDRFYLTCDVPDVANLPSDTFSACPTLLQEKIVGDRHIRLNLFGEQCFAAAIDTDSLDWRPDLTGPISAVNLPDDVVVRCRETLRALGLAMGIIDLKVTPAGEYVWLEVNPQGQFLFLEPLTGLDLAGAFAAFLSARERGAECQLAGA